MNEEYKIVHENCRFCKSNKVFLDIKFNSLEQAENFIETTILEHLNHPAPYQFTINLITTQYIKSIEGV